MTDARWRHDGWTGAMALGAGLNPADLVRAGAAGEDGRRSRHARTIAVELGGARLWVKRYPEPDGHRAVRAARMCAAVRAAGLAAPDVVLVGRRGGEGLLVTRDVGGRAIAEVVAGARARGAKRAWLRVLGTAVGRLHALGFVHGDLVPSNLLARDGDVVFLDHDRTRRSRVLVWWHGRRNLVQLGRFVVRGVGVTDRARVLAAYGAVRGLSRRRRHRLARWVATKTIARRCAVDAIPPEAAARAGFAAVMRSGGPFDRAAERPR